MAAGTAYAKRYAGGFVDGSGGGTPIDSVFLNAVEAALLQLIAAAPGATDGLVMQWDNANTRYGPALILNKNVDAAAAIAKSKLDFTGANGIVNADVAGAAAIAYSKLNLASSILNADVAAAAAIAGSKLNLIPATTLNASPTNGEVGLLTDSTSAPTYVWAFVWNNSASKWVFIGGSPQSSEVDTAESRNSTSFGDCATVHSLTLARAGLYEMTYGAQMAIDSAKNNAYEMSPKFSAAEALDADAAWIQNSTGGGGTISGSALWTGTRTRRITVAASSQVVTMRYKQGTASASNVVQNRYLKVTPVWVT